MKENLQNAPIRKEIYCIYKSAIKNIVNSIVGILQKVNNSETHTNINSNELLQSQLTGEQNKKMRLNKIPDDVLWKEEIGKSGYTAYLLQVAKIKVNMAQRENRVILDILLQKYNVCGFIHTKHIHNKWSSSHWHLSWWCIHPGLPHASECRILLKLNAAHIQLQSSHDSWWQVLYKEKF